jgi:hypothetical protein
MASEELGLYVFFVRARGDIHATLLTLDGDGAGGLWSGPSHLIKASSNRSYFSGLDKCARALLQATGHE